MPVVKKMQEIKTYVKETQTPGNGYTIHGQKIKQVLNFKRF